MLATADKKVENTNEENVLTFYEKIKIKNNLESIFSHYNGSYVFIEINPWKEEYIIRGKFHVKLGIFAKFEMTFDGIEKLRKYSDFIESIAFLKNACDEKITPIRFRTTVLTDLYDKTKDIKQVQDAAGHTTAAMPLKYYVKGRHQERSTATPIATAYGLAN